MEQEGEVGTVGGGERVRLCNPCVPDPNTTPPQPQETRGQSPRSPRTHSRSQSSTSGATIISTVSAAEQFSRNRSVTLQQQTGRPSGAIPHPYFSPQRIMSGTPPSYFSSGTSRSRPLPAAAASSSSSRPLPRAPALAEEDECPVCHRELPPRSLPNSEALREAHITICITSHSTYSAGRSPGSPSSPTTPRGTQGGPATHSMLTARQTGMFPYVATEKDCVDSAECTICLEEFEVGVGMARLECLCRFHRSCIRAWFVKHPGRCPVHQHDGFGF